MASIGGQQVFAKCFLATGNKRCASLPITLTLLFIHEILDFAAARYTAPQHLGDDCIVAVRRKCDLIAQSLDRRPIDEFDYLPRR